MAVWKYPRSAIWSIGWDPKCPLYLTLTHRELLLVCQIITVNRRRRPEEFSLHKPLSYPANPVRKRGFMKFGATYHRLLPPLRWRSSSQSWSGTTGCTKNAGSLWELKSSQSFVVSKAPECFWGSISRRFHVFYFFLHYFNFNLVFFLF